MNRPVAHVARWFGLVLLAAGATAVAAEVWRPTTGSEAPRQAVPRDYRPSRPPAARPPPTPRNRSLQPQPLRWRPVPQPPRPSSFRGYDNSRPAPQPVFARQFGWRPALAPQRSAPRVGTAAVRYQPGMLAADWPVPGAQPFHGYGYSYRYVAPPPPAYRWRPDWRRPFHAARFPAWPMWPGSAGGYPQPVPRLVYLRPRPAPWPVAWYPPAWPAPVPRGWAPRHPWDDFWAPRPPRGPEPPPDDQPGQRIAGSTVASPQVRPSIEVWLDRPLAGNEPVRELIR